MKLLGRRAFLLLVGYSWDIYKQARQVRSETFAGYPKHLFGVVAGRAMLLNSSRPQS